MKTITISILLLLLVGCAGNPTPLPATSAPTATPAPTTTPTPTPTPAPTPTPVPLAALDLAALIVQPGDLPAGYTAAQLREEAPGMYRDVPPAAKTYYQQFAYNDAPARGVAIFLYPSADDRETAYTLILDSMIDPPPNTIGEKSAGSADNLMGTKITEIIFIRCIGVIHISFSGLQDLDAAEAYAKRLDERLSPLLCQYP